MITKKARSQDFGENSSLLLPSTFFNEIESLKTCLSHISSPNPLSLLTYCWKVIRLSVNLNLYWPSSRIATSQNTKKAAFSLFWSTSSSQGDSSVPIKQSWYSPFFFLVGEELDDVIAPPGIFRCAATPIDDEEDLFGDNDCRSFELEGAEEAWGEVTVSLSTDEVGLWGLEGCNGLISCMICNPGVDIDNDPMTLGAFTDLIWFVPSGVTRAIVMIRSDTSPSACKLGRE